MKTRSRAFTFEEAVEAIYRYWLGDVVQDITAAYGVNTHRLYEALKGNEHPGASEAAMQKLEISHPEKALALQTNGSFPLRTNRGVSHPDLFT